MATVRKKTSSRAGGTPTVKAPKPTKAPLPAAPKAPSSRAQKAAPPEAKTSKAPSKKAVSKPEPKSETPAPTGTVKVGDRAPSFTLPDGEGKKVSSQSLKGRPYVLYFYPKDNTPGCTQEACDFRDHHPNLKKLGVEVLGVSPDAAKSHQNFAEKYQLPFRLIVDADKELAEAYGVWALKKNYGREFMGIVRSTFLIDGTGRIAAAWRGVRVAGHAEAVLAEAKKVCAL
jgi:thioredoxin-dependent peroxiredoxin